MATKKKAETGQVKTPAAANTPPNPPAKAGGKRKPNAAFMQPMVCSEALQAIVGKKPMPRTDVTKKVWDYIKQNGLQDSVNRKMINPNPTLALVIGEQPVSMFDMTKKISKHLSKTAE